MKFDLRLFQFIDERFGRVAGNILLAHVYLVIVGISWAIISFTLVLPFSKFVLSLGEDGSLSQGVANYSVIILYTLTLAGGVWLAMEVQHRFWIPRLKRIISESNEYAQQVRDQQIVLLQDELPRQFKRIMECIDGQAQLRKEIKEELSDIQSRLSVLEEAMLTPTSDTLHSQP